jgi:predicted amidophosphoribosyltransferase
MGIMWKCRLTVSSIEVFSGNNLKGEYLLMQEPYCHKCSAPEVDVNSCIWHSRCYGFERAYSMGLYYPSRRDPNSLGWNDFLSQHIRGAKMYPGYAVPLGLGLTLCVKHRYASLTKMDLIIPVPKFKTELKKARNGSGRLYNQAAEIAKVVSAKTKMPFADVLGKLREQGMKSLSEDERWEAVKGLYTMQDSQAVKDKKIVLIDDVYTSGATVSECSDILLQSGVERVNVLVAGRDTG